MDSWFFFIFPGEHKFFKNMMKKTKAKCFLSMIVWQDSRLKTDGWLLRTMNASLSSPSKQNNSNNK
jgi:hypothetical protein